MFKQPLYVRTLKNYPSMLTTKKELTISQIAMDCGFSAINAFNRFFKESTGTTPREYKNRG